MIGNQEDPVSAPAPHPTAGPKGLPSGLRLRVKQAPNAVRRAIRHPGWFAETVRGAARRRRARGRTFSLEAHREYFVDEDKAVAIVTGRPESDYRVALDELWTPLDDESDSHPTFGGRPSLVRMVAGIVRLVSPEVMVETGVAQGVTTASILNAMSLNEHGHLYSIDLPVLQENERSYVGKLVPAELRGRWTLALGPSGRLLAKLANRLGQFDVFLHDAEHSYESQIEEYRVAWPHLRPGGILISDDVGNAAFVEFAAHVAERPFLVGDPQTSTAVGLLRKGS